MKRPLIIFLAVSHLALGGCSLTGPTIEKIAQAWIGHTVEEMQLHWGVPDSMAELSGRGGRLLTYHEIEERAGRDNRAFCRALGLGAGWASLCDSEGEMIRSECMVNVAASDAGIIRSVAIVRDLPGGWLSLCRRIIRPASSNLTIVSDVTAPPDH